MGNNFGLVVTAGQGSPYSKDGQLRQLYRINSKCKQSGSLCHQRCDIIIIGYRLHQINSVLTLLHKHSYCYVRFDQVSPCHKGVSPWVLGLLLDDGRSGLSEKEDFSSYCSLIHPLLFIASRCSAEVISSTQAWSLSYSPVSQLLLHFSLPLLVIFRAAFV